LLYKNRHDSRLYEQIQELIKLDNKIAKGTTLANEIKEWLSTLELLMIKKLIRRAIGTINHSNHILTVRE
jgi:hypothetical protein